MDTPVSNEGIAPGGDGESKRQRPTPPPVRTTARRVDGVRRRREGVQRVARPRLPIRRELSAGGVVVRREGELWLVALLKTEHKRGDVWVLPKGHVELHSGERVSDAARREVQEEAGLQDLSVKNQLGVTRFKFQAESAVVYKTVHYFLMVTAQRRLTPQKEEGLLEAAWFPFDEAITALAYDTDQEIVRRARERVLGTVGPERHRGLPRRRQLKIHT